MKHVLALFAVGLLVLSACDTSEPVSSITGDYRSTEFAVTIRDTSGVTAYDAQAHGGFIALTLKDGGTVEDGHMVIPGDAPDLEDDLPEGGQLTINFGGTWSRSDNTVTFDHETDTFIRDAAWTYVEDERLLQTEFEETFGDTTEITVTLLKQ